MSRLECVRETCAWPQEWKSTSANSARPLFWTNCGKLCAKQAGLPQQAATQIENGPGRCGCRAPAGMVGQLTTSHSEGKQSIIGAGLRREFESVPRNLQQREAQPPGACITSPKRNGRLKKRQHKKEHVGYKVQVAETARMWELRPGNRPKTPDRRGHPDATAVMSGSVLVEAGQRLGLEKPQYCMGWAYVRRETAEAKAAAANSGPASPLQKEEIQLEDFQISVEERKAICRRQRTQSAAGSEDTGKISYRRIQHHAMNSVARALRGETKAPTTWSESITALQHDGRSKKTEAFTRNQMRNAIEGPK